MFHVNHMNSLFALMSMPELKDVALALKKAITDREVLTADEHTFLVEGRRKDGNSTLYGRAWYYPNHIQTIKKLRERTGMSLLDAKNRVGAYIAQLEKDEATEANDAR